MKVFEVIRLLVSIVISICISDSSGETTKKDVLVFPNRSLLFGSVLFVELIDGSLCLGDGLLTFCFTRLVSLPDLLCLFLAPFPVPKRVIEYVPVEVQSFGTVRCLTYLITSGSSSWICWLRMGVDENAEG